MFCNSDPSYGLTVAAGFAGGAGTVVALGDAGAGGTEDAVVTGAITG